MPPKRGRPLQRKKAVSTPTPAIHDENISRVEEDHTKQDGEPVAQVRNEPISEGTQIDVVVHSVESTGPNPSVDPVPVEEMLRAWYEANVGRVNQMAVESKSSGASMNAPILQDAPMLVPVPPIPHYPVQGREPLPSLGKYVKELKNLGCWAFAGLPDPEAAIHWIKKVESTLIEAEIPEAYKVRSVSQLLERSAQTWWNTIKERYPTGVPVTWNTFRQAFDEEYYTRAMKKEKETQFLQLQQGSMTVIEYEQRFRELSQFATRHISDEYERCDRFVEGLDPRIRGSVHALRVMGRPMREIVESAQAAERTRMEIGNARKPPIVPREIPSTVTRRDYPRVTGGNVMPTSSKYLNRKRSHRDIGTTPFKQEQPRAMSKFMACPVCK